MKFFALVPSFLFLPSILFFPDCEVLALLLSEKWSTPRSLRTAPVFVSDQFLSLSPLSQSFFFGLPLPFFAYHLFLYELFPTQSCCKRPTRAVYMENPPPLLTFPLIW